MPLWTVLIEAEGEGDIWQALHPAETIEDPGPAEDLATSVAYHQTVAEGAGWRVRVWRGADADEHGSEPDFTYQPQLEQA